MKKLFVFCFCVLLLCQPLLLTACTSDKEQQGTTSSTAEDVDEPVSGDDKGETIVSRVCTLPSGKTYLEVDGRPYTLIGAQLRIDGLYNRNPSLTEAPAPVTDEELAQYFEKAKEIGINTISLALEWSKLEPEKDDYDFSLVDKLLSLANRYELKCEFLWFSTNMCGDGHSFCIPSYITEDTETYPVITAENPYYSSMYGQISYPILNGSALMERESLVLTALMEHIYEWNKENGSMNPLIGMQIHNESDGLLRWRLNQQNLSVDGKAITPEELWQMTLEALDNAGKAVKAADYKIYTRCNMTTTYGVGEYLEWSGLGFSPLDILHLEGIDIIGDDPYTTDPSAINRTIHNYSVEGNYPHIAENMGNYSSSPSLILSAYQAGGAYMIYDLATPKYFVYLNGNSSYQMDQGILNPDLSYKAHTQETSCIIKGIAKMGSVLPLVGSEDFAAFNILTEHPKETFEQTVCTSSFSVTYRTENGGIAFAVEYDGYIYFYTTSACTFTVNNASYFMSGESGRFDGEEFVIEEKEYIGTPISLSAGKLMRVRIREIKDAVA